MPGKLFLFAGLALWSVSSPAAQISISNSVVQAGVEFTAAVQLAGQGSLVAGLQFDLEFDPGLVITSVGGAAAAGSDKTLSTADLGAGAKRFLVIGLNRNTISDGVVLSLNIVTPSANSGTQYSLHASNSLATDQNGDAIALSAIDGGISVDTPSAKILAVISGASFLPGIVDGAWISIFGTNLSTSTRNWQLNNIVNGKLPTSLDSVSVTIDGKPAAISYISPTQLNVQVPATGKVGPVAIIATSVNGSAETSAIVVRNSPGLFVFSQGGGKYPAALIAQSNGGVEYLGPTGLLGTLATRPAKPGDILELYATGLGPTSPAVPPGQVFSGSAAIIDPIAVNIGGIDALVGFAGLTGAGLYQLNVTLPHLPPGDQPLTISVNGVFSQPGVFVAVGQ